jgi:transcriptional regulator with XRE-family HTH domain
MRVGDWVKNARKHKGLTQDALGDALGVSKSNVSAWENGHHEPSIDQWLRIAQLTGHPALPDAAGPSLPPEVAELAEYLAALDETTRAAAVATAWTAIDLYRQRVADRAKSALEPTRKRAQSR